MNPSRMLCPCLLAVLGICASLGTVYALDDVKATGGAAVSGSLKRLAGDPVPGVEITLAPTDYRGARAFAASDDGGAFSFDEVVPGDYRMRIRATGLKAAILEAVVLEDGATVWEFFGVVGDKGLPLLPLREGQSARVDVTLAGPDEPVPQAGEYRRPLDRITDLVQQGKCDAALPELESRIGGSPGDARAHYLLGYCRASLGRSQEGADALGRALELEPDMPGAALLLAQVLMQAGKPDEAATWFRKEAESGNDTELRANAWIALGFLHRDAGRANEAIEAFGQARALAPQRPAPYAELASLHAAAGRADEVREVLEAARSAGPVNVQPLLNLGISAMNEQDYAAATVTIRAALDLAGTDEQRAMAWALLGRCQLGQQKRQEGLESLRKSLELDEDGRFAETSRKYLAEYGG